MTIPATLFLFLCFSIPSVGWDCGRFPTADFRNSHDPRFRGTYSNRAFGYRIRLPRHVIAYGEPPPQPAHGVGIILSWEPRSYLVVDGSGNASLLPNVDAAANDAEKLIRTESTGLRRTNRRLTRLGQHRALRITIEHTCPAGTFITDEILLLKRDIVYTVSLTTPKRRYRKDKRVLDAIVHSFELIKLG
jgi:hypothetical protein